jgi:murein DD-endopeptidase MepM/ murein hydrolase activator NlpD
MRLFPNIFLLPLIFLLSSCVTQPPAPIENGSGGSTTQKSSSKESYYDTIEEKGKVREFWGGKEVKENPDDSEDTKEVIVLAQKPSIEPVARRTAAINHEVIEGETLDSIAKKYEVSKEVIIATNNLEPPYKLEELQILKIPPQGDTLVEVEEIIKEKKLPPTIIETEEPIAAAPINMPVEGKIILKFGENNLGNPNQGINIAAPVGSEIHAMAEGVVMHSGFDAKFGNLVIIKSSDSDIFTAYAHMSDLMLKNGENITSGQLVGHVGQTGKVTSPQLHFAVRQGKTPIDPITYLEK